MERFDVIKWVVEIVIPIVTAVAGYLAGRRKRDNDFLGDLQKSIDILAAKNKELLEVNIRLNDTLVALRKENAELKADVQALRDENGRLLAEVQALRTENNKLSVEVGQLREQLNGIKTITRVKKDNG